MSVSTLKMSKWEKYIQKTMMWLVIMVVTAASFSGWFTKWSFRDDAKAFGFEAVMDERATKPSAYRILVPDIAKGLTQLIPEKSREKLDKKLEKQRAIEDLYANAKIPPQYRIEYYWVYIISFFSFFASVLVLRKLLSEVIGDIVSGTLGALTFAILVPFLETLGGYYYDFPEFLFFFWAARCALHGNWKTLLFLSVVGTYNKETFFCYLLILFPLLIKSKGKRVALAIMGGCLLLSGVVDVYIHMLYADNLGGFNEIPFLVSMWNNVVRHITTMLHINQYFYTSTTYGFLFGAQMFFLHVIFVAYIVRYTWREIPEEWKQHAKLAALVNVPLYVFFCNPMELRNLSFLDFTFALTIALFIRQMLREHFDRNCEINISESDS